jgi:hypothetical protein
MHGAIPPLPQYAFRAWCLVKHRENFTVSLLPVKHLSLAYAVAEGYRKHELPSSILQYNKVNCLFYS